MKADYDAMDLVNGVLEGFDEAKSHPWTETWASAVPRFWLRCATKFVLAGAIGDSSFLTGRGCHVSSGPKPSQASNFAQRLARLFLASTVDTDCFFASILAAASSCCCIIAILSRRDAKSVA